MSGHEESIPGVRAREKPNLKTILCICLGMLAGCALVLVFNGDFGITWDEGAQARYGQQAVRYITSGFEEQTHMNRGLIKYCGPLIEMIPVPFSGIGGLGEFETRHLICGLLALMVIPGMYFYTRSFGEWISPAIAVSALIMMPRFTGHAFNNSKDIPFCTAMIWFMAALAACVTNRDFRWRRVTALAVAMGLTLCVRPGGFSLLIAYLGGATLIAWGGGGITRRTFSGRRRIALIIVKMLVVVGIAWTLMVLFWPWAHEGVITHPLTAMSKATRFPEIITMLFEGAHVRSDQLPWYYIGKYVLITTPPTIMLLAAIGLVASFKRLSSGDRDQRASILALTAMWLFLPLVAFVVIRPHTYDGLRHFIFVLPAVAILSAVGASALTSLGRGVKATWALRFAALVLVLLPIKDLVRLHPYQMTYFNAAVGGIKGAAGNYETDYWVASYREAMLWINERARSEPLRRFIVLVGGGRSLEPAASYYAEPNVDISFVSAEADSPAVPAGADYYIATTRFDWDALFPDAPIVHSIGRDGAVFTIIKASAETDRQ